MFCPNCKSKLSDDDMFCSECGTQIDNQKNSQNLQETDLNNLESDNLQSNNIESNNFEPNNLQSNNIESNTSKPEFAKNKITIILSAAILAVMAISIAAVLWIHFNNQKYTNTFKNAELHFSLSDYNSALNEYKTALGIKETDEAKLGLLNCYININDFENAKAFSSEIVKKSKNEEFVIQVLNKLNEVNSAAAYEILTDYIKGNKNLSSEIQKMVNSAKAEPVLPAAVPEAGTYIKLENITLINQALNFGHSICYTIDGKEPEINNKYEMPIKAAQSIDLKVKSFNGDKKATETASYHYDINTEMLNNINDLLNRAKTSNSSVSAGNEVGNCSQEAKNTLEAALKNANTLFENANISFADAEKVYKELNDALANFNASIIAPTDKSALQTALSAAETLYNDILTGKFKGYKDEMSSYLTSFNSEIESAKNIINNNRAKQEEIDNSAAVLNKKVDEINAELRIKYIDKTYKKYLGSWIFSWSGLSNVDIYKVEDGCIWATVTWAYSGSGYRAGAVIRGGKLANGKVDFTMYHAFGLENFPDEYFSEGYDPASLIFNEDSVTVKFGDSEDTAYRAGDLSELGAFPPNDVTSKNFTG